ncbi:MAG: hypothetical protein AAF560_17620 [Acidobacteriota bacterium]
MDSLAFTDYVRSLDPSGEPPDPEAFDRVWATLTRAVRSELRKRGLWDVSPEYLGVFGAAQWQTPNQHREASSSALEELVASCYSHIFVRRLGGLKAQLAVKPNIEGLVFLGIRNRLHDLQKRYDPLGFRVFEILRSAVRGALQAGEVCLLAGDRRIRNDTVLGSAGDTGAPGASNQVLEAKLDRTVRSWNDLLLPELVTARGEARTRVTAVLQSLLAGLPPQGFQSFTYKQIIEPLKGEARARWGALLDQETGEPALETLDDGSSMAIRRAPSSASPDFEILERDRYAKLVECVSELIDRRTGGVDSAAKPSRADSVSHELYLSRLWELLHTRASATRAARPGDLKAVDGYDSKIASAVALALDTDMKRLSARKLAKLLRIPRERVPGLFEVLQQLMTACGAASSEISSVNSWQSDRKAGESEDQRGGQA